MEGIPAYMAAAYDKAARMVRLTYYSEVAEGVVGHLGAGVVLDLGTGPGYLPIEIARRAATIDVVGIDLTPRLIEIARKNSVESSLAGRLRFEVMNAARLRYADDSFDMVISTGMLHGIRSREGVLKVLTECYRVLRPDGELWIYDPARVFSAIDIREWRASLSLTERFLYRIFALSQVFHPPHYYTRDEIIGLVAATKFDAYLIEQDGKELRARMRK